MNVCNLSGFRAFDCKRKCLATRSKKKSSIFCYNFVQNALDGWHVSVIKLFLRNCKSFSQKFLISWQPKEKHCNFEVAQYFCLTLNSSQSGKLFNEIEVQHLT